LLLADDELNKPEELLLSLAEADSNEYVRMRAKQLVKQAESNQKSLEKQKKIDSFNSE